MRWCGLSLSEDTFLGIRLFRFCFWQPSYDFSLSVCYLKFCANFLMDRSACYKLCLHYLFDWIILIKFGDEFEFCTSFSALYSLLQLLFLSLFTSKADQHISTRLCFLHIWICKPVFAAHSDTLQYWLTAVIEAKLSLSKLWWHIGGVDE